MIYITLHIKYVLANFLSYSVIRPYRHQFCSTILMSLLPANNRILREKKHQYSAIYIHIIIQSQVHDSHREYDIVMLFLMLYPNPNFSNVSYFSNYSLLFSFFSLQYFFFSFISPVSCTLLLPITFVTSHNRHSDQTL